MKRNFFTFLFAGTLFLGIIGFGLVSCGKDGALTEAEIRDLIVNENDKTWYSKPFTITANQWVWNDAYARFECERELPATDFIYEKGIILCYIYVTEDKKEYQKVLPYVTTYHYDNGMNLTETISFDVYKGNPSKITFFIQSSDRKMYDAALQTYTFKVLMHW